MALPPVDLPEAPDLPPVDLPDSQAHELTGRGETPLPDQFPGPDLETTQGGPVGFPEAHETTSSQMSVPVGGLLPDLTGPEEPEYPDLQTNEGQSPNQTGPLPFSEAPDLPELPPLPAQESPDLPSSPLGPSEADLSGPEAQGEGGDFSLMLTHLGAISEGISRLVERSEPKPASPPGPLRLPMRR